MSKDINKPLQDLDSGLSELSEIVLQRATFNVFDVLKVSHYEIRHSNVLAWLFDLKGTHGLKSRFLAGFINSLKKDGVIFNEYNLVIDDSVLVYREFNNIDLIIQSKKYKWIIAIENKIKHFETENQLENYTNIVFNHFPDYEKIFLFLTRNGVKSSLPTLWKSTSYALILELIENLLNESNSICESEIIGFLKHYQQILRRDIVKEDKTNRLLLEFYHKNKEILDKIIEVIPDNRRLYKQSIVDILQEIDDIIIDDSSEKIIRFTSNKLDYLIPKTAVNWTSTNRLLLFEIENHDNALVLKTVIGPTDTNDKDRIVKHMKESSNKSLFCDIEKKQYNKFAHVNKRLVFSKESSNFSDDEIFSLLLKQAILESVIDYVKDVETHFESFKY